MEYVLLAIIAFCPAIFYMLYIVAFDHFKPEPPKALLISALFGIIGALFVICMDMQIQLSVVNLKDAHSFEDSFFIGFVKVSLPSEIAKWLLLCVFLSLNKFYDEYIDGIVYSVCLAMGYVGFFGGCLLYSYMGGELATLLEMSAITVFVIIPIHFITGTVMGYYMALARKRRKIQNHALALFLPILINGLLSSLVVMIGCHWEYYFITGVIFTVLAMVVYTQIFHLLDLDGVMKKR